MTGKRIIGGHSGIPATEVTDTANSDVSVIMQGVDSPDAETAAADKRDAEQFIAIVEDPAWMASIMAKGRQVLDLLVSDRSDMESAIGGAATGEFVRRQLEEQHDTAVLNHCMAAVLALTVADTVAPEELLRQRIMAMASNIHLMTRRALAGSPLGQSVPAGKTVQ